LLVSELPLFSLKFKRFGFRGNQYRYLLLVSAILLLSTLGYTGIPLIIVVYVLLSIVNNIFSKNPV
jgi:CDP-diacylglycerol--serine O-phosphatidyltransferase